MSVRTTSWEWDGERTDLHDVFSLLWGMNLRVRDVTSVGLLTELNPAIDIDSEVYARLLVPLQAGTLSALESKEYFKALGRESFAVHDLAQAVLGLMPLEDPSRAAGATYKPEPRWMSAVKRNLRLPDWREYEFRRRTAPDWRAFTSTRRGVSVVELGRRKMDVLRDAFSSYRPRTADAADHLAFRTDALVNAVPNATMRRAFRLLAAVEGETRGPVTIPFESHVVVLGRKTFVALRQPCGAGVFEQSRTVAETERVARDDVFLRTETYTWRTPLDPSRFEELVGEILEREPGMHFIRQIGATNEPDDGRDFMAEWTVPPSGAVVEGVTDGMPLMQRRHVLVQVKIRGRGVSKQDMPDIRDTLEHHRCSGLMLVAFPNITAQFANRLLALRRSGRFWIDWWQRGQIEQRLRQHPDIVRRFADLVTVNRP
ncbi:hypothetical protein [Sphingomonas abietis]|uniref:Restriction endonuclease type IV Mrr domain-containing protein n=1 Tax=Sphingomonas abietis TaxID=3012344 RepID=A0ABY7NUS9_9SPHN|nr:hypothetical protein [Sphingomonas abietis]WBO23211.1 hypothetical protein PBT88_03480 [Sphingomonas abietis]